MLSRFSSCIVHSKKALPLNIYKALPPNKLTTQNYLFQSTCKMSSSENFQDALKKLKTLKEEPGNDVKLNLYALYKQATDGACKQPKPSMFDMVGKAKHDAWSSLGSMSQEEAKSKYVSIVNELCGSQQNVPSSSPKSDQKFEGLSYTVGPHITEIVLDRPQKRNAILTQMYTDLSTLLQEASQNDTAVTVLTGRGEYFSSGNDLSNFANVQGDISAYAEQAGNILKNFVAAFIDFPKILVAAVNGPAVGIPVTILGLCDVVYASDKATFQTPFSFLGQSPEGCSTYTFPKLMGYSKANEILYFNKKFNATEAKELGLVSEILPHDKFMDSVKEKLAFLPDASKKSLIYSKELVRGIERDALHKANEAECKRLVERWQSPDCMEAIMKFFQRKSKL